MNKQKISGSYYTPDFLANFVMTHILPSLNAKKSLSILEPSVGDGSFIKAFQQSDYANKFDKIDFTAVEKNTAELDKARQTANKTKSPNVKFRFRGENFLDWQLTSRGGYSVVIGNPPYIKRNYIHEDHKLVCEEIHASAGLKTESIKNIWSAFLIKCIQLLNNEGIIAFVLPAELLQSNFTKTIRDYLVSEFDRIEVFTFNDLLFDAIGQDTVLLVGYKKAVNKGTFYTNIENIQQLKDRSFTLSHNEMVQRTQTKWTHHILESEEIELLNDLKQRFGQVGSYCTSKPGIVTAANKFFIVNSDTERDYDLTTYSSPIIQKGFFVNGKVVFDSSDLTELINSKRPSKFLNFSGLQTAELPSNINRYFKLGIDEDIPSRYKCIKRDLWFVVPNIPASSEGFFFKRCHRYPKLLKNEANILVTDSAYQIDMIQGLKISDLIFSFYNSLTLAFSELDGRYYGGGVLELTPKEFKALPVPYVSIDSEKFNAFKQRFKDKKNIEEILFLNDKLILHDIFKIDNATIKRLQVIKSKLTNKRLRKRSS